MKTLFKKLLCLNLALLLPLLLAISGQASTYDRGDCRPQTCLQASRLSEEKAQVISTQLEKRGQKVTYDGGIAVTPDGSHTVVQEVPSLTDVRIAGSEIFVCPTGMVLEYWRDNNGGYVTPGNLYTFEEEPTLHAVWQKDALVLHGNGGGYYVYGEETVVKSLSEKHPCEISRFGFKRDGYLLTDWNTQPDGSGTVFPLGMSISDKGIHHLYAQWEKSDGWGLTYNGGGAQTLTGEKIVQENLQPGEEITISGPEIFEAPSGTVFLGWLDNDYCFYAPGDVRMLPQGTVLEARWGTRSTILYENSDVHPYFNEEAKRLPNREGFGNRHRFLLNWNTKPDGSGISYEPGGEVNHIGILKLYAQWKTPENAVILDGGGARTADGAEFYEFPANGVVPAADLFQAPENQVFLGWTAQEDGGFIGDWQWYLPGHQADLRGEVLQAQWGTRHIAYFGNGGLKEGYGTEYRKSESHWYFDWYCEVEPCMFRREGYRFNSWNTEPDGTGQTYPVGLPLENIGILKLYAQWEQLPVDGLVLNGGGAFTKYGEKFYVQSQEAYDRVLIPDGDMFIAPKGTVFLGWQDNDFQWYLPGETHSFSGSKVLEAIWGNTHFLLYGNGGWSRLGEEDPIHEVFQNDGSFSGYEPYLQEGHLFTGWNTEPDGSGTSYGTTIDARGLGIVRLYAQWEEISGPNLIYDGGSWWVKEYKRSYVQNLESYEDVAIDGTDQLQIDNKKEFIGWMDKEGNWYLPGEVHSFSGPTILIGQRGKANLFYHGNGGQASGGETVFNQRIQWSEGNIYPNMFLKSGYIFSGWNTQPDGTGTNYPEGTQILQLGIIDLFAQWEPDPNAVHLCHFDVTPVSGAACRVGVYDNKGKMLGLADTQIVNGEIQAEVPLQMYKNAQTVKLFQMDSETCVPFVQAAEAVS